MIYLYRFTDPKIDNYIYIVSKQQRDAVFLRKEMNKNDHGGMPYEEFKRVWQNGPLELVISLDQIPPEHYDLIPYSVDEWDEEEGEWFDFDNYLPSLFEG